MMIKVGIWRHGDVLFLPLPHDLGLERFLGRIVIPPKLIHIRGNFPVHQRRQGIRSRSVFSPCAVRQERRQCCCCQKDFYFLRVHWFWDRGLGFAGDGCEGNGFETGGVEVQGKASE